MRTKDPMERLQAANPVDASSLANWPNSDPSHEILRHVVSTPLHRIEKPPHQWRFARLVVPVVAVIAAVVIAVPFVPLTGHSSEGVRPRRRSSPCRGPCRREAAADLHDWKRLSLHQVGGRLPVHHG
jgi:hypothetical protein